jgi:hypothetical protein
MGGREPGFVDSAARIPDSRFRIETGMLFRNAAAGANRSKSSISKENAA